MKKLITFIALVFILQGCSVGGNGLTVDGTLTNVKVASKRTEGHYRASDDYFVSFGKENEQIELEVTEGQYNMLKEGLVVNIDYNFEYARVVNVSFPNLEKEKQ